MVDRKILDERGVFVSDMDEVSDRMNEIHSTLAVLIQRADGGDDLDLLFSLQGIQRQVRVLLNDVHDLEEVLTERGAIVTAEQAMADKRAAQAAPAAKVIAIVAHKTARRSRKSVRK